MIEKKRSEHILKSSRFLSLRHSADVPVLLKTMFAKKTHQFREENANITKWSKLPILATVNKYTFKQKTGSEIVRFS